ncbi:MAG TPA: peptidoglycan DD-metalloendopeptidase family protein [Steroidobacter sp.]|nr:peptidoglycan DD-metalloendopeptidase family protein [Steroidobacteraceae bacterium]HLS81384.1 peptidoglycan DD-metalloendopeptidase family protein [Steroidobacter sp.]
MSRVALDYKPTAAAHRSTHLRWLVSGLLASFIGGGLIYTATKQYDEVAAPTAAPVAAPEIEQNSAPPAEEIDQASVLPQPLGETIEFVVRRNDTLDRIFRHLKLNIADLAVIRDLPGVREAIDRLRPGDTITLVHTDGALQALQRRVSETEVLSVTRGDAGFAAELLATPIEIRRVSAHGSIESSLFTAAREAGISPEVILRMANDIFGWDIDFALDIRQGDRFSVIYEQKYRDGEYIGDGRVLAADFINNGVAHRAVYYESQDGKVADYFTPDGRSMRRQFLRAPLDFTRISSNFNPRRRHPILNTIRAHRGVDYAAPTGAVIKAAGDGRVAFVGVKGGYGRVVILEHGGGISTLYAHMSRFARGLRNGQRVKQGATIGYVGSSGAATGPHLHYEYRVNGVHKNPRTVPLPDAAPIAPGYMADFTARAAEAFADLDRERDSAVSAVAVGR